MYSTFDEQQFRRQVDAALKSVKTILDVDRAPKYAEEHEHTYQDKFALTDFMTNAAIAANINVLQALGLHESQLRQLVDLVHQEKRSVTLRFAAQDTCAFVKDREVKVQKEETTDSENKEESFSLFGATTTKTTDTSKVSSTVREYHWKVGVKYKLFCFAGNTPDKDPIELQSRSSSTIVITTGSNTAPLPKQTNHPFVDVNLTWLLQQIAGEKQICSFHIDRSLETCRTPRRNVEVDEAFAFFRCWKNWASKCYLYFLRRVQSNILGKHSPAVDAKTKTADLGTVNANDVFCPILPLMEDSSGGKAGTATREEPCRCLVVITATDNGESSPLLSVGDIDKFLNEQIRQLDGERVSLSKAFPPKDDQAKLITVAEATLCLLWHHTKILSVAYENGMDYIESMLTKQLITAIGKQIQAEDFDKFIRFHSKKFFGVPYAPKPFCHAIRRPNHYPDGVLSIESGDKMEPVETLVKSIENGPSIYVPINAATSVELTGHRYLHGWIRHKFDSKKKRDASHPSAYSLTARARQFSSFVVIVGTVSGPTEFTPKDAIILQNKDEVIMPLLLNELPTAKQFKDAISSLSPEQQRFAKSFRGMQLESSVFGVCVVQLKPQLETLLGLPPDGLTKEIQLTQDLLSLFIDYQIPSDLLSFDGPTDVSVDDKVAKVKKHVEAVMTVIESAKKKQLKDAEHVAEMNVKRLVSEAKVERHEMETQALSMTESASAASSPIVLKNKAEKLVKQGSSRRRLKQQASPPPAPQIAAMTTEAMQTPPPIRDDSVAPVVSTKAAVPGSVDFTMIPKELDAKFEKFDTDSAVRATTIETQKQWKRLRQENLLVKAREHQLAPKEIKSEKDKAFDLLDALSRSGSLPIACAELHVVVAVTHCFEKDIMGTVIQDNVNPIEKVEKTMLLMASTINGVEPSALIEDESQSARLSQTFPTLFALPE